MVDECLDKNIPLVMMAEIPSAIMSEDDTCEVLGTLLDSAIDVSCKQNDRKIDFAMQGGSNSEYRFRQMLFCIVIKKRTR